MTDKTTCLFCYFRRGGGHQNELGHIALCLSLIHLEKVQPLMWLSCGNLCLCLTSYQSELDILYYLFYSNLQSSCKTIILEFDTCISVVGSSIIYKEFIAYRTRSKGVCILRNINVRNKIVAAMKKRYIMVDYVCKIFTLFERFKTSHIIGSFMWCQW